MPAIPAGWGLQLVANLAIFYILVAPYTKVEESFNIQAVHDLCQYGSNITAYDHMDFPGVVPRSFIGKVWAILWLRRAVCTVSAGQWKHRFNVYPCLNTLIGNGSLGQKWYMPYLSCICARSPYWSATVKKDQTSAGSYCNAGLLQMGRSCM